MTLCLLFFSPNVKFISYPERDGFSWLRDSSANVSVNHLSCSAPPTRPPPAAIISKNKIDDGLNMLHKARACQIQSKVNIKVQMTVKTFVSLCCLPMCVNLTSSSLKQGNSADHWNAKLKSSRTFLQCAIFTIACYLAVAEYGKQRRCNGLIQRPNIPHIYSNMPYSMQLL